MEHWYEVGLVLHGKSLDCMFRANRKKLEGSQKKSIISDLHLKKITLAALWEKVSKRQHQKRRISSPELIFPDFPVFTFVRVTFVKIFRLGLPN